MEKAVKVLLHGLTSVNTEVIWETQDMAMSSPTPVCSWPLGPFYPMGKDRICFPPCVWAVPWCKLPHLCVSTSSLVHSLEWLQGHKFENT